MPKSEPKSEPKSSIKKTVKKPLKTPVTQDVTLKKVDNSENTEVKIESYVPKITHFKTTKKQLNQDFEAMSIDTENNLSEKSKPETLKKNFKDLNKSTPKFEPENKPSKTDQKTDELSNLDSKIKLESNQAILSPNQDENNLKTLVQTPETTKTSIGLPSFLNRGFRQNKTNLETQNPINNQNTPKLQNQAPETHNSLTSIFTRDKDEIGNIKRVFRKSIVFLTIALLSFGLSSLASSNFAFQSLLALVFTSFAFIALTNIFFIIVAHRTYVWLFLLGQFIILSITQYPYSTSLPTLIVGLVVVLLTYLAYLDLEKVQLGSRLFSIPYIVGESTKILSSVIIFIVCLSTFNQIDAKGVDKFIGDTVLSVPIVLEKVVLPLYQNNYLKGANIDFSPNSDTTVKTLICAERKLNCDTKNRSVLSPEEYTKIQTTCKTNGTGDSGCEALVEAAQTEVLENYMNQDLPGLRLTLGTKLDNTNYQLPLKQLVEAKIKKFGDPAKLNFLPNYIPAKSVIPFTISLTLLILLSIFKFIFVWIGYVVTWIVWKLLQVTGFVRLDIEMVEAEIVGI